MHYWKGAKLRPRPADTPGRWCERSPEQWLSTGVGPLAVKLLPGRSWREATFPKMREKARKPSRKG
eukprot:2146610-Pyramimonas_sp.AAC.1